MFFPPVTVDSAPWHERDTLQGQFLNLCQAQTVCAIQQFYTLDIPLLTVAEEVEQMMRASAPSSWDKTVYHVGHSPRYIALIQGPLKQSPGIMVSVNRGSDRDPRNKARTHFDVRITGEREVVLRVADKLAEKYIGDDMAEVKWWYLNNKKEADYTNVILDLPQPIHDEFYPFIEGGVEAFFDEYMNDTASILFLMGAPGTGKTSLIRWALHHYGLQAVVSHDDALIESDNMFVSFLTSSDEDILVLEDADTIVDGREVAGNKLMARFLNISDGLIRFKNKKMIFTTNLNDFGKVDEALLRPGRCFGALKFRPLTYQEAFAAAEKAGLAMPRHRQDYTLAELFNQKSVSKRGQKRVGF